MNDREHWIPDGEEPAEGPPRVPARGLKDATRLHAYLGEPRGDGVCGVCRGKLQLSHREVGF